tara:strand:+ start:1957 stop:2067 length:111 start_codon:yes stop_codon:yes gene_type:complete
LIDLKGYIVAKEADERIKAEEVEKVIMGRNGEAIYE